MCNLLNYKKLLKNYRIETDNNYCLIIINKTHPNTGGINYKNVIFSRSTKNYVFIITKQKQFNNAILSY